MAIQDVWFSNLKALIESEGGGRRGIRSVADAAGLSEEYVYQLAEKKPNNKGVPREVGKEAAKKIARAFADGRPEGWFDAATATANLSAPSGFLTSTGSASNKPTALMQQAHTAINVESLPVELQVICNAFSKLPDDNRTKVLADILQIITQAQGPPSNQGLPAYSHAATRAA